MIALIKSDIDTIYDKVIKACRRGEFVYLIYSDNKVKKEIKKVLKKFKIPFKRGVWLWRGFIVLSSEVKKEYEIYFDKIYRVM